MEKLKQKTEKMSARSRAVCFWRSAPEEKKLLPKRVDCKFFACPSVISCDCQIFAAWCSKGTLTSVIQKHLVTHTVF